MSFSVLLFIIFQKVFLLCQNELVFEDLIYKECTAFFSEI